jgi:hypothetical protein
MQESFNLETESSVGLWLVGFLAGWNSTLQQMLIELKEFED